MEQPIENNLASLPEEVFYLHLFPFLKLNDLLRLRRVSRLLRDFSQDYIRNNFTNGEREINETDHTVADFIYRNMPTSRIYLNNSGPEFFKDPHVHEFLQLYAPRITHLRVNHFSTCISVQEDNFFFALVNLQHLELKFIDARKRSCLNSCRIVNGQKIFRDKCYFPPTFRNLKTLKLNEIVGSEIFDQGYAWDFIEFCTKVEHLKHPLYKKMIEGSCEFDGGPFGCVMKCIKNHVAENPDVPVNLKSYDFELYEEQGFYYFAYLEFVRLCYRHKIKILNLDASLHDMVHSAFRRNYQEFAAPLVSVKNVHAVMFLTELPNLEKVVINSIQKSSFLYTARGARQAKWPQLKILDINIDSDKTQPFQDAVSLPTSELFEYLFCSVKRNELKDLAIRFPQEDGQSSSRSTAIAFPVPRVTEIVKTCENVTRLTLSNWMGTNKAVSYFWDGLLHLEEVVLDQCKMLGDAGFVGKDRENPSFLKLTKLRKVSLVGLEEMPKLTDLVFTLVFKHLMISEFKMSSNKPVSSITTNGIRSLLTGRFDYSVQKFCFDNWSLANVSREEFQQLKSEFRASYML